MRFMMLVKASEKSESGEFAPEDKEMFEAMDRYNQELVKAGVMLAGEGLLPSSQGMRLRFTGKGKPTVIDGPFAETKELLAGFWIIQVKSREEAIEWASRAPFGPGEELELRPIAEIADFPEDVFPPELAASEQAMRDELTRKSSQP